MTPAEVRSALARCDASDTRVLTSSRSHPPDTKAVAAHRAYHGCIEEALRWSVDTWGFAHLFDIHGQSHRQVMEFGAQFTYRWHTSIHHHLDLRACACACAVVRVRVRVRVRVCVCACVRVCVCVWCVV
jgi:hypothetical protein